MGLNSHTVVINKTKNLNAWGRNSSGQIGNNSTTDVKTPIQIGAKKWVMVACGESHTAAIDTDGYLYTWGENGNGQIGNNSTTDVKTPTKIGTKTWAMVACGGNHTAAIDTDGYLYTWGGNIGGRLGNGTSGTSVKTPTKIGTKKWASVACGGDFTAAIDTDGYLYTWGANTYGQLANGKTDKASILSPTKIGTKKWASVACGLEFISAIDAEGYLFTSGRNNRYQLGVTVTDMYSLIQVTVKKWAMVACGAEFAAAIDTDGYLYTWGSNSSGQIGNEKDDKNNVSPQIQIGTKTWAMVACGGYHTAAIDTDGFLYTWGWNGYNQIGNDDTANVLSPLKVENIIGSRVFAYYSKTPYTFNKIAFLLLKDEITYTIKENELQIVEENNRYNLDDYGFSVLAKEHCALVAETLEKAKILCKREVW